MQRRALLWGHDVTLMNLTGSYGAMNLAGPKSMELLQPLTNIDLSRESFPYLSMREGTVAEVPARLTRVGFVGELGCEIHVPYEGALHVWNALMEAGRGHQLAAFGVEAQRLLRLEKGHIIVSQDTDGLTHPSECHLVLDGPDIAGRVTSITDSPTLGHPIGLAYVRPTQSAPGTMIRIRVDGGEELEAEVVEIPFHDPTGEKQK